ncbi:MAG TPA: hypothetical protein P5328_02525 [Candidatus Paceibacterota bacterium]|nr:hypothetical protein [Candidatus Paceibacterota bacterium]HRZ34319.1 hypothetical protein [Candidatus Paceibacterota bacterium]
MSLDFQKGDFYQNTQSSGEELGFVTRMFIKLGVAKDQRSANVAMLVFVAICFALILIF